MSPIFQPILYGHPPACIVVYGERYPPKYDSGSVSRTWKLASLSWRFLYCQTHCWQKLMPFYSR